MRAERLLRLCDISVLQVSRFYGGLHKERSDRDISPVKLEEERRAGPSWSWSWSWSRPRPFSHSLRELARLAGSRHTHVASTSLPSTSSGRGPTCLWLDPTCPCPSAALVPSRNSAYSALSHSAVDLFTPACGSRFPSWDSTVLDRTGLECGEALPSLAWQQQLGHERCQLPRRDSKKLYFLRCTAIFKYLNANSNSSLLPRRPSGKVYGEGATVQ